MRDGCESRGRARASASPSRRLLALLGVLAGAAACEGPTLSVGKRAELDASQASDANQARDATRVRPDAEDDDDWDDPHACRDFRDCDDNTRRRRCNMFVNRCVECLEDHECPSNRCGDNDGLCREVDKPRP